MGGTLEGRTRHRKIPDATHRHSSPGVPLRGRASLSPLFPDQPTPHALSGVPCARLVYFHRRGGGRVQGGHRYAAQTRRDALDRSRLQRDHCSSLLETQWSFSGLLGTQGRMTHHFPDVHPRTGGASLPASEMWAFFSMPSAAAPRSRETLPLSSKGKASDEPLAIRKRYGVTEEISL